MLFGRVEIAGRVAQPTLYNVIHAIHGIRKRCVSRFQENVNNK
jgi:hypothetical protein